LLSDERSGAGSRSVQLITNLNPGSLKYYGSSGFGSGTLPYILSSCFLVFSKTICCRARVRELTPLLFQFDLAIVPTFQVYHRNPSPLVPVNLPWLLICHVPSGNDQYRTGAYPGGMHRMHVHPPSPPCASPPSPA
jgi:hypothetical protein